MLIVCNGAIKSGSTWLYNILVNIVECIHPPSEYLTSRSVKSPCITPEKVETFLQKENIAKTNYITKNHLSSEKYRSLFLNNTDVYVFDIERDPRDVVVSNYYHDKFRNGYEGDFSAYYWHSGRYVVDKLTEYHNVWRHAGPRSYVSSYERLQTDFASEVNSIARVLGLELSLDDIDRLKEKTSLSNLRTEYKNDERFQGEKFFRKGEVGDWKNHFDNKMLADISHIMSSGISKYDRHELVKKIGDTVSRLF